MKSLILLLIVIIGCLKCENNKGSIDVDPNGYIIFCLCMGRVGNQIEHLLGGMDFAKRMNRTLILPSFRTYASSNRNVPFDEWFSMDAMQPFHRMILADDFMQTLAPQVWPSQKRFAFCWSNPNEGKKECKMKEGNPFGPFWDGLKVDFVDDINFHNLGNPEEWNSIYPPDDFPVIAMRGAPASFPMKPSLWSLQRFLVLSDAIQQEAEVYINEYFPAKSFIGIHLRNGIDWTNACSGAVGAHQYMASPQCLQGSDDTISKQMCLPSKSEVLRLTRKLVMKHMIKVIFVATDQNPMIKEISQHLSDKNVQVYHADPSLPLIDWAILIKADYFIGNCVSSFTSFVKRSRDVLNKPTIFWGNVT